MKIVVLTGSPHRQGTSAKLAQEFIRGAQEAGHGVIRFDAAFQKVNPCLGCDYCRRNDTQCVQKDTMEELRTPLLEADLVVFVTPLYYFGMSAQLKAVLDRFYAINTPLRAQPKQTMLLATCGDAKQTVSDALLAHYRATREYLGWQDRGTLIALGAYTPADLEQSDYPEKAYLLGKNL